MEDAIYDVKFLTFSLPHHQTMAKVGADPLHWEEGHLGWNEKLLVILILQLCSLRTNLMQTANIDVAIKH